MIRNEQEKAPPARHPAGPPDKRNKVRCARPRECITGDCGTQLRQSFKCARLLAAATRSIRWQLLFSFCRRQMAECGWDLLHQVVSIRSGQR